MFTAFVITVSDRSFRGEREDLSGPSVAGFLAGKQFHVVGSAIVPDEAGAIGDAICGAIDNEGVDLVVTTGGTGLSPRDVTPEATLSVIDRHIPGFPEIMRKESIAKTAYASFSRGVCGIRGKSIVINLPGSPKGAIENIEVIGDILRDAVREVRGEVADCSEKGIERLKE
ncbi:MAG: molybdenum cofactor biosynthesis protein [Deltaproteobacteria bacterium]|nr:molybdenum cofactor biosynthesis protein [Deltaproteobacteria bacterium]NIS76422.1 molybdenum cofactor biosynthesis protein [Deltaproteobacteria bacterium]